MDELQFFFADEGIVRRDKNDSIDTHGNNAPDGILGPHREKEGSFYAIKEIWSPVHIDKKFIPQNFDGKLLVENRYMFTNLNQCTFKWKLVSFGNPNDKNVLTIHCNKKRNNKFIDVGLSMLTK